MSKAKHTERLWTLRPVNEEIGEYEIVGPHHSDETGESEYIAVVCGGLPEYEDNARLIAAAPELLEALEELLTRSEERRVGKEDRLGLQSEPCIGKKNGL